MKKGTSLFNGVPRIEETDFWRRCSQRRGVLFTLFLSLAAGLLAGPLLALFFDLFSNARVSPVLFSGIPAAGAGFLSCFSAFLLNLLIFLTVSFLLGVTAFGIAAIPLLVFFKGVTVGLGVYSFLSLDGLYGLGRSALSYIPAAAVSLLVFLLFSLRSLTFSDRLRRISFSSSEGELDFRSYWRDYVSFLCAAVTAALAGAVPAALGSVFFH